MKRRSKLKKLVDQSGPLIALLIMCTFLAIVSPKFLTINNLMKIIEQSTINGLISLGLFMAILTAGIDLSVGSIVAFSSMIMGLAAVKWGVNPYLSMLLCLGCGAGIGLINGVLLTRLNLPHPFISTMATKNIFRGLTLIVTASVPISGLPGPIQFLGSAYLLGIPVPLVLLLVVYTIFFFIFKYTVTGRHIYAVGGNYEAARLSGIDTKNTITLVYIASGFMAGLAGIVLAGRVNAVYPTAGIDYETDAIAATIIGGTSFMGGIGTVHGTLFGALIIGVLRNGLNLLNVPPSMQTVLLGCVIVGSVYVDVLKQRSMKKIKPGAGQKLGRTTILCEDRSAAGISQK